MLPDKGVGAGCPGQGEIGRDGGEDPLQTAHPAPFLIDGEEGRNGEGRLEFPAECGDLGGILEIAGEEDDSPGPDRLQLSAKVGIQGGSLHPDEQELACEVFRETGGDSATPSWGALSPKTGFPRNAP